MVADIMIMLASFLLTIRYYPGPALPAIEKYQSPFVFFVVLFLTVSFIFNKYEYKKDMKFLPMLSTYAKALLITAGISALALLLFQLGHYSRSIIFGTILGIAVLEFLWLAFYQAIFYSINKNQHPNPPQADD
jgi:hypothetical protein